MHIGFIGASGKVGRTALQNFILKNEVKGQRLTLVSPWPEIDEGLSQDIENALPIHLSLSAAPIEPIEIIATDDYAELAGADLIIVTASLWPSLQQLEDFKKFDSSGRLVQAYVNDKIVAQASQHIARYAPNARVIMVTNQADLMAAIAREYLVSENVLGFGGAVDSSRLRMHICQYAYKNDVPALLAGYAQEKAHMIGFHCNEMIALSSSVCTPGLSVSALKELSAKARDQGGHIARLQIDPRYDSMATGPNIMPGMAVFRVLQAATGQIEPIEEAFNIVLEDPRLAERYGVPQSSALSVPVVFGKSGYKPVYDYNVTEEEKSHLLAAQNRMAVDYKKLIGKSGAIAL